MRILSPIHFQEQSEQEVGMVERQPSIKRKLLSKPYPENLILTLMIGIMESIEVTSDMQMGLDYALATLTDVEREVLRLRFEDRLTYAQIGSIRERTGKSACGVENNAMRKLRRPPMIGYILYGKERFTEMDHVFHWPWEAPPPKIEPPNQKVSTIPFEELDLTVRSFNNLRRAGYEYVGDIINLTYDQILKIPYLPRKNCNEIAWKLWNLGFKDTCWKYFQQ